MCMHRSHNLKTLPGGGPSWAYSPYLPLQAKGEQTCTHARIFSPTHHFPEVKFVCLCGGGGVLHFYPHFPEVNFPCVWGGGGLHFYYSKRRGGGLLYPGSLTFPHVPHFPILHLLPLGEKPDGGPTSKTDPVVIYIPSSCLQSWSAKEARCRIGQEKKGGGASLIWGARHKSDLGGGGKGLSWGAWGVGGWWGWSIKV